MAKPEYIKADDLFKDSRKTNLLKKVKAAARKNRQKTILDMSNIRRQEDWSLLSNKTFGAEGKDNEPKTKK